MLQMTAEPADNWLRPRGIPLLNESHVPIVKLAESHWLDWTATPRDYFDVRVPNAFQALRGNVAVETAPGQWRVEFNDSRAAALTFELAEQVVGWPGRTAGP